MTEIVTKSLEGVDALAGETRAFGWRVFDLADLARTAAPEVAMRLRQLAARASRHLAQRATAYEGSAVRRQTEQAFKCLCDAVDLLDAVGAAAPELSVDASALAAEATELSERLFELCCES